MPEAVAHVGSGKVRELYALAVAKGYYCVDGGEFLDDGYSGASLDRPALSRLREAVRECKRFTKHEAIRRQMQYIGRIMRDVDAGPIAAQLSALATPSRRQAALFHAAERWRQEMLADSSAIDAFLGEYPEADPHALRRLVAAAHEERSSGRAPRQYRELFHWLNALIQDHARRHP